MRMLQEERVSGWVCVSEWVREERREERCSWSWKAESRSERGVAGGPGGICAVGVPGRRRRVDEGAGESGIWTSVNGGGEGSRGEGGADIAGGECGGVVGGWWAGDGARRVSDEDNAMVALSPTCVSVNRRHSES